MDMLDHLANIVATGTRTSSGFKKVHFNACARAVNEKFNTKRSGEQIKNHLKIWQRRYAKINRFRRLSAAGWDEDNFIITLDPEHYNDYVKDHKADAKFLNKPLQHYVAMATIFGNSMATEKYAKDSSSALGSEDATHEDEGDDNAVPNTPKDNGASSSATRPNKRARHAENEDLQEEGPIGAFKSTSERIAKAIEKCAGRNMDLPLDLFHKVHDLPGFDDTHKSYYYTHLVENPHVGRAFYSCNLPAELSCKVH
uniref:Myb/SANT-like domain-containing protein n=1 Tax=Arundo donax TaxID=35708 RepID=A0A0A9GMB9_ARUDO